ncbi:MAG TPA: peptidase C1 [Saprospiraceae bacterium]|nr:peptidase C1 [Saprospiraceae bacterium]
MMKKSILLLVVLFFAQASYAQVKDAAEYIDYNNPFYGKILKSLGGDPYKTRRVLKALPTRTLPLSHEEFTTVWCNEPVSQGRTGTCWSFSTSSFYESEIFRKTKKEIKLSELYLVYYEYLAKAEEYIRTKGKSHLGEGSETNALAREMKKHGLMPLSAYSGNAKNTPYLDHKKMFGEFKALLESHKARDMWDKDVIMAGVKAILHTYMGTPPKTFYYNRQAYDPMTFMRDVAKINPEEYVNVMSLKRFPYWQHAEWPVPDNYWHSHDYINVPLEDFMTGLKNAVKAGYSVSLGGDVSEPGYLPSKSVAIVPTFDIPEDYIDENARQMRFDNGSTTDDHAIHVIGYKEDADGKWWFLIKDSGSSARNGVDPGYFFFHEDYVKLKMMTYTVHQNAILDMVGRVIN